MKYKVESRATFPYNFDIWDVKWGDTWYASFASKKEADEYCEVKNRTES